MKKYSLILLSGGVGSRMENKIPKQHILLNGKPIILHTLEVIDKIEELDQIIIACNKDYIDDLKRMISNFNLKKSYLIVEGGSTRQESVYNALLNVENDNVIIHEAARPFVFEMDYKTLMFNENKNVTYGVEIPFTVLKKEEDRIAENLNRNSLVNIQLPQKFETKSLLKAHKSALEKKSIYTEDSSMLLKELKEEVKIISGKQTNIKITYPLDFSLAEIIYKTINRKEI